MNSYEYEKYITTPENLKNTIMEYGVGIIPNVINSNECEQMKNGMWDFLEFTTQNFKTPIKRNDVNTHKAFNKLYPIDSMLVQNWGIGHAQFLWDLRQNTKIIDVFKELWDDNNLLVSFDGASFHFPNVPLISYDTPHLHSDQSYCRNDFECVQSWITAYDVSEGDATLTFLENSNKLHKAYGDYFNVTDESDYYEISNADGSGMKFYLDTGCKQKYIKCKAGDMVFWDSRTVHSGSLPLKESQHDNTRCVAYLCYMPKKLITPDNLEKKQLAFLDLMSTCHWPHKPELFSELPYSFHYDTENNIHDTVQFDDPVLSKVGKKLAGF
jgi:ectoine hydroxylase-related dioxygenase (phytanoyl-CoA dioxygenase family)